jgi:hypothetical protein
MASRKKPNRKKEPLGPGGLLPLLRESVEADRVLDVVSFATRILGLRLYPVQKTLLRLLFLDLEHMSAFDRRTIDEWRVSFTGGGDVHGVPPDIWERIDWARDKAYWHFRVAVLLLGRRGSKNFLGSITSGYMIYRLIAMGSPQVTMGIDPDKDIVLFVSATNREQSKDNAFTDIATMLERVPWFEPWLASLSPDEIRLRTPGDMERARTRGKETTRGHASIVIRAISSNAPASRGPAGFMAWFDELAHTPVTPSGARSGEELFQAVVPSLAQAKEHALILITTSPWTQTGQAFETYQQAVAVDEGADAPVNPDMVAVVLTSFDPYRHWDDPDATEGETLPPPPITYNDIMQREERRNPSKFRTEHLSQWAAVLEPFLEPGVVDRIYLPYCPGCGHSFPGLEWRIGAGRCPWCSEKVSPVTPSARRVEIMRHRSAGHADPAEAHDNFSVCIGHLEPFTEPDGTPTMHVIVDHVYAWIPSNYDDHQLPFPEIQEELFGLILGFPNMPRFTYDQFGAMATIKLMKKALEEAGSRVRVAKLTHTESNNKERAEIVKEALANNWIHAPRDVLGPNGSCLLEQEMKFLQLRNGKLSKPSSGPVRSDDIWTSFSTVTWQLLKGHHGRGVREALSRAPLLPSLPGGYHTGGVPDEPIAGREKSRGRQQLERLGRSYGRRHPFDRRRGGPPHIPRPRDFLRYP